eukprot:5942193-Prymnesium_polylepis.1
MCYVQLLTSEPPSPAEPWLSELSELSDNCRNCRATVEQLSDLLSDYCRNYQTTVYHAPALSDTVGRFRTADGVQSTSAQRVVPTFTQVV